MAIKLNDWRDRQLQELNDWADTLDRIITPERLEPKTLHDYPRCREISAKLRQICIVKEKQLADRIQRITDELTDIIEREEVQIRREPKTGFKVMKRAFPSAASRDRELRIRLSEHDEYPSLEQERSEWDTMARDWKNHENRLRQEQRVLEIDYAHNGGQSINLSPEFKLEKK